MFSHSTLRWFAGLGVAGALLAASATPAVAAEDAPFEVIAQDTLTAPDHIGFAYIYAQPTDSETSYQFGRTTLDIDFSGVSDFAVLDQPGEGWGWACETSDQVVHCAADLTEDEGPWLGIQVTGKSDATPGQKGQLKIAVSSGGRTARTTSTVTLAEGVDLQAEPATNVTGAPGTRIGTPSTVHNGGETTTRGAVLLMNGDYLFQYAGDFSNCRVNDFAGTFCTFDEELEPGKTYRLSASLPFQLHQDARTGATLMASSVWWTKDDWELVNQGLPQDGTPGDGERLRLVEVSGAKARVPQTDTDTSSNYTDISVKVTGDQPADLRVKGATAGGKKGDVVQVRPSFTNLGPALLEWQGGPLVRVTIPQGTTAVEVSGDCQPYTSDEEWDQWNGKWGEPGAKEYACQAYETPKDAENGYEFGLRIDKVVPNASGAVQVRLEADPNRGNDKAKIVINPAAASGGGGAGGDGGADGDGGDGGDGGTLPITGSSTGLIGGLLLAIGIAGFLLARRRRTSFSA